MMDSTPHHLPNDRNNELAGTGPSLEQLQSWLDMEDSAVTANNDVHKNYATCGKADEVVYQQESKSGDGVEDKEMFIAEECANTPLTDALVTNSVCEFKDVVPKTDSITPLAQQLVAPVVMVDSPLQMVKQDQPKSEDGDEIGDDVFYQGILIPTPSTNC
jgi:hypothetical protein